MWLGKVKSGGMHIKKLMIPIYFVMMNTLLNLLKFLQHVYNYK